jgi:predicted DNA-binding transcriptional regulator YafY
MRAARVLDMLLVLQRGGRTTAPQLARTLEVSERTVLRDVEALSEAGVPIFTTRGAGGGIELVDGYQTRLTGLTTDEALCLFLVGQPQVAHRLGLGAPTRTSRNKLLNGLTPALAAEADRLSTWFLHDPDPWTGNRVPHGELRRLSRSIHQRRKVELTIAHEPLITVRPLGLVLKAGSWHLVVMGTASVDVMSIDQLRATRLTNQPFTPPPTSISPSSGDAGSRGRRIGTEEWTQVVTISATRTTNSTTTAMSATMPKRRERARPGSAENGWRASSRRSCSSHSISFGVPTFGRCVRPLRRSPDEPTSETLGATPCRRGRIWGSQHREHRKEATAWAAS